MPLSNRERQAKWYRAHPEKRQAHNRLVHDNLKRRKWKTKTWEEREQEKLLHRGFEAKFYIRKMMGAYESIDPETLPRNPYDGDRPPQD